MTCLYVWVIYPYKFVRLAGCLLLWCEQHAYWLVHKKLQQSLPDQFVSVVTSDDNLSTPLLSTTFTMLVLLTLVIQCSLILLLVKALAVTVAPPAFNRANLRHPLQERAMQANGRVELNATANLGYPVQETEPPLSQEDAAVQEASGVRLGVRVVQLSLHQRKLPSARVTGRTGVSNLIQGCK